ncbi:MAG: 4-hydroxy-tetrahydrodipicolinate synthase [Verrucomicrobiota bacterium]|nr:4-hydroxy-tetrahydrodipicolinate synthase [Verrucomicrobiota bacterium]
MFNGTYTALVTPFRNGKIDTQAFDKLIQGQIAGGVDGIVPVGTTGESPTLDHDEHIEVIRLAKEYSRDKLKVIAGTGANCTKEAIELTLAAEALGIDGTLQVAPYYNKPSQEGLYQHFAAIARATKLPIILYSIPGRCGIEISVETTLRLATDFKNVVCMKEAGGTPERVSALRQAGLPGNFTILSGDDSQTLPFMSVGAVGVISVASNLIPLEVSKMVRLFAQGDLDAARRLHERLYPAFKDLFIETNPVPIKAALAIKGLIAEEYRLPLVPMSAANRAKMVESLKKAGAL